jgi:hypothetical protein
MAYTTIKKPSDYFNTVLYTGNNTAIGSGGNAITGVGFQPDLVWIKRRASDAAHHAWYDAVRGTTKQISSSQQDAETTQSEGLTTFGTDGFTIGNLGRVNEAGGDTYASWNWLGANGTASNTDGSITSTVSANTTSGFSIVKYTGNGTAGATIGHGLSSVPNVVLIKALTSSSQQWNMYHSSLGNGSHMHFNLTNAVNSSSNYFNNTTPTSSVFSVGSYFETNESSTDFIAYCFAEKKGFSKFGSYTGNGNADGPFIYTGFKPAWILIKHSGGGTAGGEQWNLQDVKRSTYNPSIVMLSPNTNDADNSTTNNSLDILSNGFKVRTVDNRLNNSGATYIYMAFAEEPLVGDNPATAR